MAGLIGPRNQSRSRGLLVRSMPKPQWICCRLIPNARSARGSK
jgi:hypothetical protein